MFENLPGFKLQAKKASYYIKRLFSLKLVRLTVVLFLILLLGPIIFFYSIKPKTPDVINYGVTFSDKYSTEIGQDWKSTYLKILDDLGAKNLRLVAYWDDIEPSENLYDFRKIEWMLQEADKRDLNIILTIGRKVPRYPECFEPVWWKKIPSETTRDEKLYEYLARAVKELQGHTSVKMWQVENEPFFPFGTCLPIKKATVEKEVDLVKALDSRPILIQDSGEGGFWFPTYQMSDYLGISMYRKIWFDFWGVLFNKSIYFQYPLSYWTYDIKAHMVGVPINKIIVTELQAEPWGPVNNIKLSKQEKDKTMSVNDFIGIINYAQKAGFKDLYFWGAEWWLWEKEQNDNGFYWNTAKALFNEKW